MENSNENIRGQDTGELREEISRYPIVKINLADTVPYSKHPFKVCEDDGLRSLAADIEENGLLHPIIVRRISLDGKVEILSGHRRAAAAKLLGWTEIEARMVYVSDSKAAMIVIQSNFLQRDKILPSEKAKSFKLRFDCLDLSKEGQKSHRETDNSEIKRAVIAKEFGESASSVYRYLRLNYLINEILDLIDKGSLRLQMAVDLSYFTKTQQLMIYRYFFVDKKSTLKAEYIKKMRRHESNLSEDVIDRIVSESAEANKVSINKMVGMYASIFGNRSAAEEQILKILQERYAELERMNRKNLERGKNLTDNGK